MDGHLALSDWAIHRCDQVAHVFSDRRPSVLAISRRTCATGAASASRATPDREMNGFGRFLVIVGLAVAGLLVTMSGAQAEPAGDSAYARNVPAAQVMPRGGEGQAEASASRDFDWTPLVILGGLLGTGVAAYLLYSVRHPA
jgi:hypothetical protein